MSRLIDADVLKEGIDVISTEISNDVDVSSSDRVAFKKISEIICRLIDQHPTVKVPSTVHAEWIDEGDCHRCSNCKAVLEEDYRWHYHAFCYHCGANMTTKAASVEVHTLKEYAQVVCPKRANDRYLGGVQGCPDSLPHDLEKHVDTPLHVCESISGWSCEACWNRKFKKPIVIQEGDIV